MRMLYKFKTDFCRMYVFLFKIMLFKNTLYFPFSRYFFLAISFESIQRQFMRSTVKYGHKNSLNFICLQKKIRDGAHLLFLEEYGFENFYVLEGVAQNLSKNLCWKDFWCLQVLAVLRKN